MTRKPTRGLRACALTAAMSLVAMLAITLNPTTAQAVTNPPLPTQCGLDVAVVMDASGSISPGDFTLQKNSSKGLVNVLEGTPSGVGIYTFATGAQPGNALGVTSIASNTGATTVRTHIDGITQSGGSTNWGQGFSQVPNGTYDVIVFITDGFPNSLPDGVAQADLHKTAGTTVLAVGVGAGANASALQAISGPTLDADYFMISNFGALETALRNIAYAQCQGSVTVVKETQDNNGNVIDQKAGWTFTSNGSPASDQTGADGTVNFTLSYGDQDTTRNAVIVETVKPGWGMAQQGGFNATCVSRRSGTSVPVTNSNVTGFTVAVGKADVVSCKVINKQLPPSLAVEQTITPTFVRDFDWSLTKSLAPGEVASKTVPVGSTASFNYVVTATPTHSDANYRLDGVATLTNPSLVATTGQVTSTAPGMTCTTPAPAMVAGGTSVDVAFSCTSATKPAAGNATSTVTWTGGTDNDVDGFNFDSTTPTTIDAAVTVEDDLLGIVWAANGADGVFTKNYTLQHDAATLACQPFVNTATLTLAQQAKAAPLQAEQTVTVCGTAKGVGVTNTADGSFQRDHSWSLTKTVNKDTATVPVGDTADFEYTITATPTSVESDFEIHGSVTVTNSNAIALSGIDVVVSVPGGTCTVPGGTNVTIAAGANAVLAYHCTLPGATSATSATTTATVTWEGDADPGTTDSADAGATVDFATVDPYQTDETVTVEDDLAATSWTISAEDGVFTETYVLTHKATGLTCEPYTNTANIEGIQIIPNGLNAASVPGPVSRTVTVCGTALAVSITNQVVGDFDRDHDWTLSKTVNTTNLLTTVGHEAQATYTLKATPSTTDSNFRLTGTTTVTNSNTVDVSALTVTVVVPDGTCTVVDGSGLTIVAGATVTLDYTCTLTSTTDADTVTTLATVVWEGDHDPATVESDDESASADFSMVTPAETDAEVVLTDDLGELSETLKATGGAFELSYLLVWTPTTAGCVAYPNIASLTDDGVAVTSTATVTVCAVKKPNTLPDTGTPMGWTSLLAGLALGGLIVAGSRIRRQA